MSGFALSLNTGRRLCKIIGGKDDGKIIYLYDSKYICCADCSKKCRGKCCDDCSQKYYHNTNVTMGRDYCKIADDGIFQQVPTNIISQTDVNMYAGKRGCGKSFSVAGFAKQYKLFFPKNRIFMFSQCKDDPALNDIIDKRIDLDQYSSMGGLTVDHFNKPCLIIFDDIDMIQNTKEDKLRDKIYHLMNSLIQLSRKKGISICQTSHIGTNHNETRHILNAASSFTFYLQAVSMQIKNALKIYFGLSPAEIRKVLDLKQTRQVTIFTTSPTVIMTDKELFIVNGNDKQYEYHKKGDKVSNNDLVQEIYEDKIYPNMRNKCPRMKCSDESSDEDYHKQPFKEITTKRVIYGKKYIEEEDYSDD